MRFAEAETRRRIIRWIAVIVSCFAHSNACPAAAFQPSSAARAEQWFNEALSASREPVELNGCTVEWIQEIHYTPPMAEIIKMREDVRGKPEHPDRPLLVQFEQRLQGRPEIHSMRLWYHGPNEWRQCLDFESPLGPRYWDTTSIAQHCWFLVPETLSVASSPDQWPGDTINSIADSIRSEVTLLLHGGLTGLARTGYRMERFSLHDSRWRAELVLQNSTREVTNRVYVDGDWNDAIGRGFVSEIADVVSPSSVPRRRSVVMDWRRHEELNTWVAHRYETHDPDGRLHTRFLFKGARKEAPGEFEAVTAIPPIDGEDPIRGPSKFIRIADYSNGILEQRAADGAMTSTPIATANVKKPAWHRWVGWVMAVVLCGGIAASVLRRRLLPN